MGIDEQDIGDIPIVAKRQSSAGNGKIPAQPQNSMDGTKISKKEGVLALYFVYRSDP